MRQRGQISILVLIIAALSLTFGLSLSKKAVTEVKVGTNDEETKQAFNVAESALNSYYGGNKPAGEYNISGGTGAVTESSIVGSLSSGNLEFPEFVPVNEMGFFWLMAHNTDGSLNYASPDNYSDILVNICLASSYKGALAVDIYYWDQTNFSSTRAGYNINTTIASDGVAGFTNVDTTTTGNCGVSTMVKVYAVALSGTNGAYKPVFMAVRPLGTSSLAGTTITGTKLWLNSDVSFPSQGNLITSTGKFGQSKRTIRVNNLYSLALPYTFMMQSLTSGGSIISN